MHYSEKENKSDCEKGRHEFGLYVLERGHAAFLGTIQDRSCASFELSHSQIGHVLYDIITLLNNLGHLFVTSLLPKPHNCSSCQLVKSKRLPFFTDEKRSTHVFDKVHCDLWGSIPILLK